MQHLCAGVRTRPEAYASWYAEQFSKFLSRSRAECALRSARGPGPLTQSVGDRMRWTVRGTPRVPWDAVGIFDGVSTFRLDKDGRIYEHQARTCVQRAACPDPLECGKLGQTIWANYGRHRWLGERCRVMEQGSRQRSLTRRRLLLVCLKAFCQGRRVRPGCLCWCVGRRFAGALMTSREAIFRAQVDNVILRDPPMLRSPLFAGLNLLPMPAHAQQPCPGAWFRDAPAPPWQAARPAASVGAPAPAAPQQQREALAAAASAAEGAAPGRTAGRAACDGQRASLAAEGSRAPAEAVEGYGSECGRGLHAPAPHAAGDPGRCGRVSDLVHSARSAVNVRRGEAVEWLHSLRDGDVAPPPFQAGAP